MNSTSSHTLNKIKSALELRHTGSTKVFDFFFKGSSLCFSSHNNRETPDYIMKSGAFNNAKDFDSCIDDIYIRIKHRLISNKYNKGNKCNDELQKRKECMRIRKVKNQLKRKLK